MGTRTRGFANFIGTDGKLQQGSLAAGVGGIAFQAVKTANFNAVAGEGYFLNTTSGEITVTLPSSPSAGDEIIIVDYAGTFATNNLIITSTPKINGSNNDVKLTTNREATRLVFIDATQGYIAYSGVNEGTSPSLTDNPPPYSVDFLVIAGGASGGGARAAGGGAGGYRTSTQTVTGGTVITVTVGDGGASVTGNGVRGNSGVNSSISGSGLTTITSAGGGGGGGANASTDAGGNGGSGGGSTDGAAVGSGNTPSTSPSQGNDGGVGAGAPNYGAGGGGGAGAVGVNGTTTVGGNGGAGTTSSITGSSVTRAGGGGGATYSGGTAGQGGTGGGGNANVSAVGSAGVANTGGGGGGGFHPGNETSGAGGKGVVILSVPTANYSNTSTGSPTVTTSGANTILQFNGDGSYTA